MMLRLVTVIQLLIIIFFSSLATFKYLRGTYDYFLFMDIGIVLFNCAVVTSSVMLREKL